MEQTGAAPDRDVAERIEEEVGSAPVALGREQGSKRRDALSLRGRRRSDRRRDPRRVRRELVPELGVRGFDAAFWYGLVAPAGTPAPIVARVQAEVARQFTGTAEGRAELTGKDVTPEASTPDAFARTIAEDTARWRALAERLGIQPE